jgi:hypothetical protein
VGAEGAFVREFGFELSVCAALEAVTEGLVARQLGCAVDDPGRRVVDTVLLEPGPGFEERAAITSRRIPDAAIESDVGVGEARYWRRAMEGPPERARRVRDRAIEIGFFEAEERGGRTMVRQVARYPDWFDLLIGFEHKPDLASPGDLAQQLRRDVSLGVLDRVILTTESHVTGAHLHRVPEPVGVWRVDPDRLADASVTADSTSCDPQAGQTIPGVEVVREPEALPVEEPGIEVVTRHPGHTEIVPVSAAEKVRQRRRVAERAYGKGWRTFGVAGCSSCTTAAIQGSTLPFCTWKDRLISPASECGQDCDGYEPGPAPSIDTREERAARSPWQAEPEGRVRRQTGLGRFEDAR